MNTSEITMAALQSLEDNTDYKLEFENKHYKLDLDDFRETFVQPAIEEMRQVLIAKQKLRLHSAKIRKIRIKNRGR